MQKEKIRRKKIKTKKSFETGRYIIKWKKPFSVPMAQSPFDWYRLDIDCVYFENQTDFRCPNALFTSNLE